MLPFTIDLLPGQPVQPQVLHAVRRAVVAGVLRAGDGFPSVRKLSQELRINPNTAHRVVATLVAEGLLEVRPGIGTVVAASSSPDEPARAEFLGATLEHLIVEARRLGLERGTLDRAIDEHWNRLEPSAGDDAPLPKDPS